MELRPYQKEAIQAIEKDFQSNQRLILVMATGCGKTIVFSHIAEDFVKQGKRVLILAHREELLYQAQDKLKAACGIESSIEKASHFADSKAPVIIASIQTICRDERLKNYPGGTFGLIIVDEAHHSVARTYEKVLHHFAETKVLGVTATPNRADRCSLAKFYDKISFEYNLPQAIKEHFLSNIHVKNIPLKLDISKVKITAGDFQAKDLGNALSPYLAQIADVMATECKGRHTVVFLPLVHLAQEFTQMLNERGLRTAEIHADSEDRADVLEAFHKGSIDVICNAMLLTEGFDEPTIDCIVILRPTKSDSLFAQMVGRGTRLAEGKDNLLLLDFLWQTKKHDMCHPSVLIAPTLEVAERMQRIIRKRKTSIDLENALLLALDEKFKETSVKEQEAYLLVDLSKELDKAEISYFEPTFQWEKEKVTAKQTRLLESFGIDTSAITSKGLACLVISTLMDRKEKGLATLRQVRFLAKKGFQKANTWTFQQADGMIRVIADNGWKIPDGIQPATFVPSKDLKPEKKPSKPGCVSFDECVAPLAAYITTRDYVADMNVIRLLSKKHPGKMPVVFSRMDTGTLSCVPQKYWLDSSKETKDWLEGYFDSALRYYPADTLSAFILRALSKKMIVRDLA